MRLSALLLVCGLTACGSCGTTPLRADLPSDLPMPSVARLTITHADGNTGSCSVFKLSDDTVGTAGHCCDGADDTYTIEPTGIEATVVHHTETPDVCIMRASMPGPSLSIAKHDPAVGESVWVYGFPRGIPAFQTAYWSGRHDGGGVVSIDAVGGYSGSPVLNRDGELVGILVSGYLGQSISFLTTVEHVRHAVRIANRL